MHGTMKINTSPTRVAWFRSTSSIICLKEAAISCWAVILLLGIFPVPLKKAETFPLRIFEASTACKSSWEWVHFRGSPRINMSQSLDIELTCATCRRTFASKDSRMELVMKILNSWLEFSRSALSPVYVVMRPRFPTRPSSSFKSSWFKSLCIHSYDHFQIYQQLWK